MGDSRGVYIPNDAIHALGWRDDIPVQVWVDKDMICIRALPEPDRHHDAEAKAIPRWSEGARDRNISVFQERKKCT